MRLRLALPFHLLCLGLLRCASLLVPGGQRVDWWREWRSELWHVRQACTPERGISWTAEREVAAFCCGAFQDALWLRVHFGQRRILRVMTTGSATRCILLLIGLAPTNQKAVSGNDCGTQRHRRVAAAGVDQVTDGIHRSSPGVCSVKDEPELAIVTVRRRRCRSADAVNAIKLAEQHL